MLRSNVMTQMHASCISFRFHKQAVKRLSVIHVAGTKGKGSTCSMCESILRRKGFKTGKFVCPPKKIIMLSCLHTLLNLLPHTLTHIHIYTFTLRSLHITTLGACARAVPDRRPACPGAPVSQAFLGGLGRFESHCRR